MGLGVEDQTALVRIKTRDWIYMKTLCVVTKNIGAWMPSALGVCPVHPDGCAPMLRVLPNTKDARYAPQRHRWLILLCSSPTCLDLDSALKSIFISNCV